MAPFSRLRFTVVILTALVALLALSQSTFSQSPSSTNLFCLSASSGSAGSGVLTSNNAIGQCVLDTIPYAVLGLLFSFQLVAFSYLIGEVLNIQSFKGWYKSELWEALKSLAVVIFVYATIVIAGNMLYDYYNATPGSTAGCPGLGQGVSGNFGVLYCVTYNYLLSQAQFSNDTYNMLLGESLGVEQFKSYFFSTYFDFPLPPFPICVPAPVACTSAWGSINLGTDYYPVNSNVFDTGITSGNSFVKELFNFVSFPLFLVFETQDYLFYVLLAVALGVLLPLGIIMRAIPFIRPIGGTLMGIAIGIILIYPLTLSLLNINLWNFFGEFATGGTNPGSPGAIGGAIINELFQLISFNPTGMLNAISFGPSYTDGYNSGVASVVEGNGGIFLNTAMTYVIPAVIQLVTFIIDLVIWIVATTQITKLLGGSLRLKIGKYGVS